MSKLNLKINYTPRKNEFYLLSALLLIAIIALFFNYLILPAWSELVGSRQQYQAEDKLVAALRADYAKLDEFIAADEELTATLAGMQAIVPPYLSQEEIIVLIDSTAAANNLKISGISFNGITTEEEKSFIAGLQSAAATPGTDKKKAATKDADKNAATDTASKEEGTDKSSSGSTYISSERITLNYTGTYQSLYGFLQSLELGTRQAHFRNAALARTETGTLNGTLTMLLFSSSDQAPVLNDPNYPGYDYNAPTPSGKSDPFAAFTGYTGSGITVTQAVSVPDFYVILNTYDDNAAKVIMGKYPVSATQISNNNNQNVNASLTVSSTGSGYAYTYRVGSSVYSGGFTPASGDAIALNILSRARKSDQDKVGMTLNVENNTSKTLNITVKNDDEKNPRFTLGTTKGKVQVIK